MIRFVLSAAVFGLLCPLAALPVDAPKAAPSVKTEPLKGHPVYVKFLWPVDPDLKIEKDRLKIESWVSMGVDKRFHAKFIAVSEWVPLTQKRYEATDVWDGKLDEKQCACPVSAFIAERKDGQIKIVVQGWSPAASEVILTLEDEPGSRKVAPVNKAETERDVPHVAVFIGVLSK